MLRCPLTTLSVSPRHYHCHIQDNPRKVYTGCCHYSKLTALHYSCLFGDFGVSKCLVGAGADLERRMADPKMTALHIAIEQVNVNLVQLLVEAGADVNAMLMYDERVQARVRKNCLNDES